MSDDEASENPQPKKADGSIRYGSLEETLRAHAESSGAPSSGQSRPSAPQSGNINQSSGETMEMESESSETTTAVLAEFDRRRRARHIAVPTDDVEVKVKLRQLGEPICLFGEGPADRRERLRNLLSVLGEESVKREKEEQKQQEQKREQDNVTWYHEGAEALQQARVWLADYSLPRASSRLKREREQAATPQTQRQARTQELHKQLRTFSNEASQIGDSRPISYCSFSPNSEMLATTSWSGLCKLWSVPLCQELRVLRGHMCQVSCVVWHPQATTTQPEDGLCLATCSQDGAVKLWSLTSDEPMADIEGHAPHRVSRLAFHPSGRFLATCCFDSSWRLWDLEVQEEILHQEGHAKAVYCIAFQGDGALACSGGHDSFGRVWDLRTGRCIMFMEGHVKSILCVDFSPNGYNVATGSEDNSCKVWDVRMRKCVYTIPAHTNIVSAVKFLPSSGDCLLTASYENTAKLWAHPTGAPIKILAGHEGKILSADIAPNCRYMATASYDRTFKLWAPE